MTKPRTPAHLLLVLPLVTFAGIEAVAPTDSVAGPKTALNHGLQSVFGALAQ